MKNNKNKIKIKKKNKKSKKKALLTPSQDRFYKLTVVTTGRILMVG